MELFQNLEREQLAWPGCANHLLDGETLAVANSLWLRNCGCGGTWSMVGLVYVGYEHREDVWRKGKIQLLEASIFEK